MEHCDHTYVEEYYGHTCIKCGVFYPWGGAPWDDFDFDDDGVREYEYPFEDDEDYFDWECPHRRDYEKGMALTKARLAKRAALDAREGQT